METEDRDGYRAAKEGECGAGVPWRGSVGEGRLASWRSFSVMHFCHEELYALLALIPGARYGWLWLRTRVSGWRIFKS